MAHHDPGLTFHSGNDITLVFFLIEQAVKFEPKPLNLVSENLELFPLD